MRQIYFVGVKSLPLATIIGIFIGMVITIQFAYGLKSYGALDKVPQLVALSMVRELGPGFIALLVGGKIGSGFAAEIGSMKVSEQIDAIRSLGDDPIRRLLSPRIIAVVLVLPFLTIWADIVSFIGGAFVSSLEYNLDPTVFLKVVKGSLKNREIIHSVVKSMVFGYLIAIIGTANGFRTGYGTESVGKSTTNTVQITFIFILITNFFLSKLFMVVKLDWLDTLW
jgi:phospholipid/cholesterol/gamma-HCH transport system permease protein